MRLVQATEAMAGERDRATWATWGGPLALQAYLAHVLRLRNHAWSQAAMTTWILGSDEGAPLASCQAYRMASRHAATPGHTYGLGSVFTEPAQRGRGLASHHTGDPGQGVDALVAEGDLAATVAEFSWPEGTFAIRPSGAQLDWQLERERILLDVLGRPGPPVRGARAGRAFKALTGHGSRKPPGSERLVGFPGAVAWCLWRYPFATAVRVRATIQGEPPSCNGPVPSSFPRPGRSAPAPSPPRAPRPEPPS